MMSKTFAFAFGFGAFVLAAAPSFAQGPSAQDKAIEKLTDSRDMSTGLPMNAPAQPKAGLVGGTANDKALEKLTDSKDMSSGLPMGAPERSKANTTLGSVDKAGEPLTRSRDLK